MRKPAITRFVSTLGKPLMALVICLPLMSMAQTGAASFSGPSVVKTAQTVVFSGRGLSPNSAVSISVTAPDGAEAQFSAVVAADGSLSYSIKPVATGTHTLKVLDGSGKVLASVNFQAIS